MAATVLITGASQGIGKATALLFAQKGYDLILASRQVDRLEALAQQVRSHGRKALAISTDVRDPEQIKTLVQKALEYYGSIDILINNAGIYTLAAAEQYSLNDWHQIIDTNLWGYIHTIWAVLPHFLERGSGTIINVGSIAGKIPIPYQVPYCTSKYAITGLTESLHAELSPKGIHVCGIHPNFISTHLSERGIFLGKDEEEARSRRELVEKAANIPLPEKPEDVAQAIWDAVKHPRVEVIVGSANMAQGAYKVVPGFMDWLFRRIFAMKDS